MYSVGIRIRFIGDCDSLHERNYNFSLTGKIIANNSHEGFPHTEKYMYFVDFDRPLDCGHGDHGTFGYNKHNGYYVGKENVVPVEYNQVDFKQAIQK
mgnify:CR=1 FL=1